MSTENFPDLMVPPFWGSSDMLTFDPEKMTDAPEVAEIIDPRGLYCFFPVFVEDWSITLLDPWNETEELVTLTFRPEFERYASFFRPDGDICAVAAYSIGFNPPKDDKEALFAKTGQAISEEIRRALMLPVNRGKAIGITPDILENPESLSILADAMSVEDRLGFAEEDYERRVRFLILFHNVEKE